MFLVACIFTLFLAIRIYLIKNRHIWYTIYYATITLFECYIWANISWSIFDCVEDPFNFVLIDYYYKTQLAAYCSFIVFMITFDKKESETSNGLLIHHVATFSIIMISFLFKYRRVGFTVLLLHDITDIFLSISRYLKEQYGDKNQWTLAAFATFIFTFVVLRLFIFPIYVFKQCFPNIRNLPNLVCIIGLIVLLGLHVFWATKIVSIIKKLEIKK